MRLQKNFDEIVSPRYWRGVRYENRWRLFYFTCIKQLIIPHIYNGHANLSDAARLEVVTNTAAGLPLAPGPERGPGGRDPTLAGTCADQNIG